ncbi:hypothetical protein KYK29_04930 [Shinella daejeonensis]|uniref:hypothetical protein n=1 Tax=Shinella daejeonensis TaxID=659017 RepID=UPI0020C759A6|nr:hypothetical protein [Shinella daejeonensis]MCP8894264.1 hypothetical protein [Shinella daejeonensis]
MNQTLKSLQRVAGSIRQQRKEQTRKQHIADLQAKLEKIREEFRAEEARAEFAERQVRQIAAERDLWKHQAQEALTKLKSLGVTT